MGAETGGLKIEKLVINGLLGIEHQEIVPGKITFFRGGTGAGKSSVADSIIFGLTGKIANRAVIIRRGLNSGAIAINLNGDVRIVREAEKDGAKEKTHLSIQQGAMKPVNAQSFVSALPGAYALSPLEFMKLNDAQQTSALLSLVPLHMTPDEYNDLLGNAHAGELADLTQHPLLVLSEMHRVLFNQRRDLGTEERRLLANAEQIRAELPADFNPEAARALSVTEINAALVEANSYNAARDRAAGRVTALNVEIGGCDEKIGMVEEQIAAAQRRLEVLKQERADVVFNRNEQSDWLIQNLPMETDDLNAQLNSFEQQKEFLGAYDRATEAEKNAAVIRDSAAVVSAAVKRVKEKPAELLAQAELPIPGMALDEETGFVTINGLPIRNLSGGEKMAFLAKVAVAMSGPLKVGLIEGFESLDPDHQAAFLKEARKTDHYWFIFETTSGEDLVITTEE